MIKLAIILILILIVSIGVFYIYYNKNIEKFTEPSAEYTKILNEMRDELKKSNVDPETVVANDESIAPDVIQKDVSVPGAAAVITESTIKNAPVLTTIDSTTTLSSQNIPVPISKNSSIVNFIAVIETFKPWGAYFAGNVSDDNILLDLFNRSNRNAIITGPIIKASANGFGAKNNINYISGNTNTVIEWGPNSIPFNYTICSITRYTGNTNNKRILTARNATPSNDWIHGHQSGKRGVVYYNNEYKTDNNLQIAGDINDWVITCATNGGTIPENIYINGIPSGIKSGGIGALQLAINKIDDMNIISERSDFALSYVLIWDTILSSDVLKIISDNLLNYLSSGEPLLFDILSLNTDDKTKVQNAKSSLIYQETQSALNSLRAEIRATPSASPTTAPTTTPTTTLTTAPTTTPTPAIVAETADAILLRAANLENILLGKDTVATTPTNNVINLNDQLLNNQSQTVRSSICTLVNKMPTPEMSSFSQDIINIPLTSTNTSDQSYLWCKCDGENGINANTKECKMFDVCRKNYANNNKLDLKSTFTTISDIDKQTYDSCIVVFENFPRYLDTNTANQNRPLQNI